MKNKKRRKEEEGRGKGEKHGAKLVKMDSEGI